MQAMIFTDIKCMKLLGNAHLITNYYSIMLWHEIEPSPGASQISISAQSRTHSIWHSALLFYSSDKICLSLWCVIWEFKLWSTVMRKNICRPWDTLMKAKSKDSCSWKRLGETQESSNICLMNKYIEQGVYDGYYEWSVQRVRKVRKGFHKEECLIWDLPGIWLSWKGDCNQYNW